VRIGLRPEDGYLLSPTLTNDELDERGGVEIELQ
jgi:hypothetical protein